MLYVCFLADDPVGRMNAANVCSFGMLGCFIEEGLGCNAAYDWGTGLAGAD